MSKLFAHRSIYFNVFGIQILYKLKLLTMTGGCNRHATLKNNKVFSRIRGHTICRTNAFCSLTFHEITLKYLQQINHNLHQQYTTALGTQSNKLHSKIQSYKRGNSNHYAQMCVCVCGWGSNLFEVKIQAEQMQYPANSSK